MSKLTLDRVGGLLRHNGHLVATFDSDHLVLTETGVAVARRTMFSPSAAKAMSGCRARFALEKLLPFPAGPFTPAGLGNAAHAVFESLMVLPYQDRSKDAARGILVSLAADYASQGSLTEEQVTPWTKKVWAMVKPLWAIEDPTQVNTFATEYKISTTVAGVPIFGIADRLDTTDDGIRIVDYKTGKRPDARWLKKNDAHGDQVLTYAAALSPSLPISSAALYYTGPGVRSRKREIDITTSAMEKVTNDFAQAWDIHNSDMDKASCPTQTSRLCSWCPAVTVCPMAAKAGLEPAPAYDGALTPQALGMAAKAGLKPAPAYDGPLTSQAPGMAETGVHEGSHPPHRESMKRFSEAKPWEKTSTPNGASPAVTRAFGFVDLAWQTYRSTGVTNPSPAHVRDLAETFAYLVAQAQDRVSTTDDPGAGIATRLSGALRTALDLHPVPLWSTEEEKRQWLQTMESTMVTTAAIVYQITTKTPTPAFI